MKQATDKLVVFYDGYCPLCTESARYTKRLDWFQRMEFLSFRDPAVQADYDLTGKDPESRIYSLLPATGRGFSGVHTVLQIFRRTPAYWPLVPFLWFSIQIGLGQRAYDWIAKRRNLIPIGKCSGEGCSLQNRHRP